MTINENGPSQPRRPAIIAMMASVTVFDGFDVFVPAYVIHYVREGWGLSPTQSGALVSSGLLGFMVGALLNGPIADRIGRRPTLLFAMWLAGLGSLATAFFATGIGTFLATRVVTGIGLGMIIPIATAYLNEFMPGRSSNVATVVATSGYTVGGVLAGAAGILLTPIFGWTVLFLIGGLGCVVATVLYRLLPESPMFSASRSRRGSIGLLFAQESRRDTFALWVGAGLALFNIYALSGWIPTIMIARGSGFSLGFFYGALLQFAGLAGGFACAALCDRWSSRRLPLTLWYAGLAAAILGIGATTSVGFNLLFVAAAGFFLIGAQPVFNNLAAHAYDTEVRATGIGMTLGVGRIGAIAGPLVLGAVQQATAQEMAIFAIMAAAAIAAAGAVHATTDHAIASGSRPANPVSPTGGRDPQLAA